MYMSKYANIYIYIRIHIIYHIVYIYILYICRIPRLHGHFLSLLHPGFRNPTLSPPRYHRVLQAWRLGENCQEGLEWLRKIGGLGPMWFGLLLYHKGNLGIQTTNAKPAIYHWLHAMKGTQQKLQQFSSETVDFIWLFSGEAWFVDTTWCYSMQKKPQTIPKHTEM